MTSKMQNGKIELRLGRANNVLENGNHDEHVDMTPEIQNRQIIHESKPRRVYNKLKNESHIIHDEYADMTSEVQTKNDTKADFDEKVSELNINSMNTVSNNSSNDRTADPNEYLDDVNYFVISDNRIDTSPASECFIDTDMLIKKTKMQRTLFSANETPQQRSDDPRRGGRVGSDV